MEGWFDPDNPACGQESQTKGMDRYTLAV